MLTRNKSLKILLVEDDPSDAALLQDLLGSFSETLFCFQTVASVEEALKSLESVNFDAIVLDLSVQEGLGEIDAIALLKARSPTIPIVVLTDINDENTALSVLRSGAQDCLVKGRFQRTLLVRAIHYAIERQYIEGQLRQQAQRERLLGKIIENIRSSIDTVSILQSTVAEVRQFLKTDRVLIYRCDNPQLPAESEEQTSTIVAGDGLPSACIDSQNIAAALAMSCLFMADCKSVQAIADIREAQLADNAKELLVNSQIAAVLSVPIWQSGDWEAAIKSLNGNVLEAETNENFAEKSSGILGESLPPKPCKKVATSDGNNRNCLWGILTAYNYSGTREWQEWEIDFLKHLANQLAIAIEQSELYRQLAIANQKLQQLATTDGLTGIANRRQFDRVLMLEWRRLAREELPLSLIMFDIDFFKLYNDFYGHLAGDDCLQQVAGAIASCVKRAGDLSARYGGEEFAVLLPNTTAEGANAVAVAIGDRLRALKLSHARSAIDPYVTLSCGIATVIPVPDESEHLLICSADGALYQAKAEGKNRICHAIPNPHSSPILM